VDPSPRERYRSLGRAHHTDHYFFLAVGFLAAGAFAVGFLAPVFGVGFLAVAITVLLLGGKPVRDMPQRCGGAGARVHMTDDMPLYTTFLFRCQQAGTAAGRNLLPEERVSHEACARCNPLMSCPTRDRCAIPRLGT
jgi:hypothetical protein